MNEYFRTVDSTSCAWIAVFVKKLFDAYPRKRFLVMASLHEQKLQTDK